MLASRLCSSHAPHLKQIMCPRHTITAVNRDLFKYYNRSLDSIFVPVHIQLSVVSRTWFELFISVLSCWLKYPYKDQKVKGCVFAREWFAGFVQGYSRNRVNTERAALHVLLLLLNSRVWSCVTVGSVSKHPPHLGVQQSLGIKNTVFASKINTFLTFL